MQKTAYDVRISDLRSDVCSVQLLPRLHEQSLIRPRPFQCVLQDRRRHGAHDHVKRCNRHRAAEIRAFDVEMRHAMIAAIDGNFPAGTAKHRDHASMRSEEHTSELQSLMRISYAVFCLKHQKTIINN